METFDKNKPLQELEGKDWGDPEWQSHLVTECHRLRKVPLCDFTVENLRIMIGQQIGLEYLVPLALEHLRIDPLVEGEFYPGDLLGNVLAIDAPFWKDNPKLRDEVAAIASGAASSITEDGSLIQAYEKFKRLL